MDIMRIVGAEVAVEEAVSGVAEGLEGAITEVVAEGEGILEGGEVLRWQTSQLLKCVLLGLMFEPL
jgi:hypothetical protein